MAPLNGDVTVKIAIQRRRRQWLPILLLEPVASMVATGNNEGFLMAPLALMPNDGNVVYDTINTIGIIEAIVDNLDPLATANTRWL